MVEQSFTTTMEIACSFWYCVMIFVLNVRKLSQSLKTGVNTTIFMKKNTIQKGKVSVNNIRYKNCYEILVFLWLVWNRFYYLGQKRPMYEGGISLIG